MIKFKKYKNDPPSNKEVKNIYVFIKHWNSEVFTRRFTREQRRLNDRKYLIKPCLTFI